MEYSSSRESKYHNGRPAYKTGFIRVIRYTNWLRTILKRIPGSEYIRFVVIDGELLNIHQEKGKPPKHSLSLFGSVVHSTPGKKDFELNIGTRLFRIYCETIEDAEEWVSNLQVAAKRSFESFYLLGDRIGINTFICYDKSRTSNRFQVDLISTPEDTESHVLNAIHTERQALHMFDCRCINGVVDMFRSRNSAHFVRNYRNGVVSMRTLLDAIGARTEVAALVVTYQILCALRHMHSNFVAHRNVRPENVLLLINERRALLDGLSWSMSFPRDLIDDNVFHNRVGLISPYASPEIFHGLKYGPAADVYATGATVYEMLCGKPPPTESRRFTEEAWSQVSINAKSIVAQMLCKDVKKRPPPIALLEHDWVRRGLLASLSMGCSKRPSNQSFVDHAKFLKNVFRNGLADAKANDPVVYSRMLSNRATQNSLSRYFTFRRKFLVNSIAILACVRLMNVSEIQKRAKRWAPPSSKYRKNQEKPASMLEDANRPP